MEILRTKIKKSDVKDSDFLYFKINIKQTFFNMGEFSDLPFIPAQILNRDLSDNENSVDLSNFQTGMYLFKIKSSEGEINKKVVKK